MASPSSTLDNQTIERFLQSVKSRCRALALLQTSVNTAIALLVWGVLLGIWGTFWSPPIPLRFMWIGGLVLAVLYWLTRVVVAYRTLKDESLSRQLEIWAPKTRGFLTALELGREYPQLQEKPLYSEELSKARVEEVTHAIEQLKPVEFIPVETFNKRAIILFSLSVLFLLSLFLFPGNTSRALYGFFYKPPKKAKALLTNVVSELVVGDLQVTYHFPSYTQLPPRIIPNSDGNIAALKGTQVHLKAQTSFPVKKALLLLNGSQKIPFKVDSKNRSISGKFPLLKTGFYRFQIEEPNGRPHIGPTRSIELKKDAYPKIKMLSKHEEQEYQERDKIPLKFQYSDDYGISKINLIYKVLGAKGKEKIQNLQKFKKNPKKGKGDALWDLSITALTPGDRVRFQVEVLDNDTITGPKRTRTETYYIRIFSPLKHHDKMIALQEQLLDRMTLFLGDLLEKPNPKFQNKTKLENANKLRKQVALLNTRGHGIVRSFNQLQKALKTDDLAKSYVLIALENMRYRFQLRQIQREDTTERNHLLKASVPFDTAAYVNIHTEEIPQQEDDVYAFSILLNRQRLDLLQHLARKLTKAQNRLTELLDKYRQKKDPKTKAALLQEMRRIEKLIRQIQKRMRKLSRQIPDDHLNMQAFRNKSSLKQIQEMRKMIKKDDLESAAQRLARLAQNIEKMVSQMDEYRKQAGGNMVSRMKAMLKKLANRVHQLEKKQRRLSQRTQTVRKNLNKRMKEALKKKIKTLLDKQKKRLAQIDKHLKSAETKLKPQLKRYRRYEVHMRNMKARIGELKKLLKDNDIFESKRTIQRFNGRSTVLRDRLEHGLENGLLERLRMYERHQRLMDQRSKKQGQSKFQQLQRQRWKRWMKHLKKNTKGIKTVRSGRKEITKAIRLGYQIEADLDRFRPSEKPFLSEKQRKLLKRYRKMQKNLRKEGKSIAQRMKMISKRMPIFQPSTHKNLKKALQEMNNAGTELKRMAPRPSHKHQQRAVAKLQNLRKHLQKMMKQQRKRKRKGGKGQGQRMRRRPDDVKIPKASQHKAPKELRQDILKAMKEKIPHKYQEKSRKYYEKLVK